MRRTKGEIIFVHEQFKKLNIQFIGSFFDQKNPYYTLQTSLQKPVGNIKPTG